jgi:hypothetical protein
LVEAVFQSDQLGNKGVQYQVLIVSGILAEKGSPTTKKELCKVLGERIFSLETFAHKVRTKQNFSNQV